MRTLLIHLSYVISFFILINTTSCDKLKSENKKAPQKAVAVLCDLSESTRNLRSLYLDSFKTILSSISHGDVIVAVKITEASILEHEIPIKEAFAEFVPVDSMGRPTDNPTLVRKFKEEADKKLKAKKEGLIETAKGFLFNDKDKSRKILRTDIMSSLHIAESVFRNYKRDKFVLVMLSDMIEDSSEYNFEKENLTDRRIEEIIRRERQKNRVPDLKNVRVYAVAASAGETKKFFAIQSFWLRYFRECGTDIPKENYSSTLITFNE
jgi:hypothetical protein